MDWLLPFRPIDYDSTYVELDPRFFQKYLFMAKICSDMHFLYNHVYLLNMFDDGVSPVPYLVAKWFELEFDPVPRVYNFAPFVKRSVSTDKSPKISESALLDYISEKTKKGETWNKRSTIGYTEGELVQFRDSLVKPKEMEISNIVNETNRLKVEMDFVQTEIENLKTKNVDEKEVVPCGDFLDANYVDCFECDDAFGIRADLSRDLVVQKTMEMRGFEKRIESVFNYSPDFQIVRYYDSFLRLSARVYKEEGKNKELLFKAEVVKFDVLSTKTVSGRQLVFIDDYVPEYEKNKNGYMVDINSGFCNDWINYYHLGDRKLAMECMDILQKVIVTHSDLRSTCKALSYVCLQLMQKIDVDSLKPYFYKLPELRVQDILIYMVKNEKINHRVGENNLGSNFFKKEYGIPFSNDSLVNEYKNCATLECLVDNKNKMNYYLKWRNLKTTCENFNYLRVYIANQKKEVGMNVRKSNVVMYIMFHNDIGKYQKMDGKFLFCDKKIYDFGKDAFCDMAFCMNQGGHIRYLK